MSKRAPQNDIANSRVVYEMPGTDAVTVLRDVECQDSLRADIYYRGHPAPEVARPAIIFVSGYPDSHLQQILGCELREMI